MSTLLSTLLLCSTAAPPPAVQLQLNYDVSAQQKDPDYAATLVNVLYPLAKGPQSMGHPQASLPVMIRIRGSNENSIGIGELEFTDEATQAQQAGFIYMECNYPVMGPGDDHTVSTQGLALLVQYLRHNSSDLNIRSDQIFGRGGSGGAINGYALTLKQDYQDLSSSDVFKQYSSRPNYLVANNGPSSLTCFDKEPGVWAALLSLFFFPGEAFEEATFEQKVDESPIWWLLNPQLYDRTITPPILLTYHVLDDGICGEIADVHDGIFGEMMNQALSEFARQRHDYQYLAKCGVVHNELVADQTAEVMSWAMERVAEDFGGLHLQPLVGEAGGLVSLRVHGVTPGQLVTLYESDQLGTTSIATCTGTSMGLANAQLLDQATGNASGTADFSFVVSASAVGNTNYFQAIDDANCEVSNIETHVYY